MTDTFLSETNIFDEIVPDFLGEGYAAFDFEFAESEWGTRKELVDVVTSRQVAPYAPRGPVLDQLAAASELNEKFRAIEELVDLRMSMQHRWAAMRARGAAEQIVHRADGHLRPEKADLHRRHRNVYFTIAQTTPTLPTPENLALTKNADLRTKNVFLPSSGLLFCWIESVKEIIEEDSSLVTKQVKELLSSADEDNSINEFKAEFSTRIKSLIADFANLNRDVRPKYRISVGGRVVSTLQSRLVEGFRITPYIAPRFLDLIYSELSEFLAVGGEMRGEWGQLVISGNDLMLELRASQKPIPPGFVKGKLVRVR